MLLVAASEDRITPVERHQRPIFEAANGPTQLRVIEGGGHCGYLDQADLIGLICGRSTLDAVAQRTLGQAALTAWLRSEAMGDAAAFERAWQPDSAGVTTVETKSQESA